MKTTPSDFLANRDIVFITLSEWSGPRRIRHHLAYELARRGNRVLFVEAYYSISKFLKKPDFLKFFQFLRRPREIHKNLFLASTVPFLPLGEFSAIVSRINWSLSKIFIARVIRNLGFKRSILVVFAYNAGCLVRKLDEDVSIYFCNDAFDKLFKHPLLQRRITFMERALIKKVNAVITVSEKLTEERSPFSKKITTIHHGVDYQLFEDALRSGDLVPEKFNGIQRPIIGYSGVVRHIIDLDLLEYVAVSKPEWSIVIVGPVTESDIHYYQKVDALMKHRNVHFLGPISSDQVPRYINQFDVCVLPYTLDEVSTYYAAPLKFYEYLAAGKPVVSTVGPKNEDEFIVINATTKESFVSAIDKALTMTSHEQITKRKESARRNSWEERVTEMGDFLSDL